MLREHEQKIGKGFGVVTWMFFFITFISGAFFLLSANHEHEFRSTMTFLAIFAFGLLGPMVLYLLNVRGIGEKLRGTENNSLFFMRNPTFFDIVCLIPLGLISLIILAFSLQYTVIDDFTQLVIAGLIFGFILYLAKGSIIIPILIHGTWNSLVYLNSVGIIDIGFDGFPINLPVIGGSVGIIGDVGSEILFNFAIVATAEEMFRILPIVWIFVFFNGTFEDKKILFVIGIIISAVIWAAFHGIQRNIF